MDILDDMEVSKLSAKVFFFKVNYSFKLHKKSWEHYNGFQWRDFCLCNQVLRNYIIIWILIYQPIYQLLAFKYKDISVLAEDVHICASLNAIFGQKGGEKGASCDASRDVLHVCIFHGIVP